jgi:hypothetical protein
MNRTSILACVMGMLAALSASACGPVFDSVAGPSSLASDPNALDRLDHAMCNHPAWDVWLKLGSGRILRLAGCAAEQAERCRP